MKKLYLLKSMLLLCALVVGSSAWATEGDILNETFETTSTTRDGWSLKTVSGHSNGYAQFDSGSAHSGSTGLHLGSGSNAYGSATTPTLSAMTPKATLTFWAKTNTSNHSLKLSATGCTIDKNSIVIANGTWTQYTVNITEGTSSAVINFYKDGTTQKYIYIDDVVISSVSSVKTPTFSLSSGTVAYGTTVEISQEDNKTIHYTTNGTAPTSSSPTYSTAIAITSDMTIKAIAVDGSDVSDVATATYTVQRPDAPTFSEVGEMESGTEVTVTAPESCTLYYTTNGDDPTTQGTSAGSNSKTFTITENQTIKAASEDSHGFFSSVATAAYTIVVFSDPTFSIANMTMEVGEQKSPVVTTNSGGVVTYTSGNNSIATIVDGKINAVSKGTVTITANLAKDTENHFKAATTTFEVTVSLVPVWESTSKGIDELTADNIGLKTSYDSFTDIKRTSSARYACNAMKNNDKSAIQLRSNNSNSGIVTTTSGGKVRKVTVSWNTVEDRTLDVYAKNAAYTSASDLYNNSSTQGTLIGSLNSQSNDVTLNITGDYQYIGLRSKSGALYLNSITIYWEGDAVSLSDASDYTPEAKDYAKVTLNREFQTGWNGVVFPFDFTTDVKTALGASDVKTLGSATEESGAITLNFTDATLPVAAGTPVLVKCGADLASGDVVINGAEIKNNDPITTVVTKSVAGNTFTLTGTYSETDLKNSEAYFVAGDKFYHKAAGVALTAAPFRSYIVQTVTNGARKEVNFNLEGSEANGIADINRETMANDRYYDLQGRSVAKPTKGLYIVNGKKTLVK